MKKLFIVLFILFTFLNVSFAQDCPSGYTPDPDNIYCCHPGADNMPWENSGYCCWNGVWAQNACCWNGIDDVIEPEPPNWYGTNGRCLNYGTTEPWFPEQKKPEKPINLRVIDVVINK